MVFRISDVSLQDLLTLQDYPTLYHWSHSIAPENIRKALVFREWEMRPLAWNGLIY